jgi:hypothetical protein
MKPRPEEEIKPEKLVRVIKKEPVNGGTNDHLKDIDPTPKNYRRFLGDVPKSKLPPHLYWGIAGLVVLFIVGFAVSFLVLKAKVSDSISSQVNAIQAGVSDLQNLDPQSAQQQFALFSSTSTPNLHDFVSAFGFLFKGGRDAASSFGDLTTQLTTLTRDVTTFEKNMLTTTANGQGASMITLLSEIRATLAAIDHDTNQLSGALTQFSSPKTVGMNAWYLPLKAQIESAGNFLDTFIPWFTDPKPHHVLVLFQNPSEMRPAGGFLGSYADITIASSSIVNIAVHDIADVDINFPKKIVPPKPLQREVSNFRPADANWFADFPTSASETIALFEQSKLYAASSTKFDAAIAVSPQVLSDILSVTGPVTLSSTKKTFTADNVVVQIQNSVQQGQATSATYPKVVLDQLSRAIMAQLESSTSTQQQTLFSMAMNWINKKDIMVFFKNANLQGFTMSHGAAGDMYQLPQGFNGDYLSIVDTNILGDKSDLYIAQDVSLETQIEAGGMITDHLIINRKHNGNQSPYWWYQTTSQDYLQLFTMPGASLTNESGGVAVNISPTVNYRNGYTTDPLIAAIESSTAPIFLYPAVNAHTESGKEVFATWARVAQGGLTKIVFDYTHRAYVPPVDGTHYQFVFDKQSGSERTYDFRIDAPLGFVFAENGLASYEYQSDNPPGRLVIPLTLQAM